MVYVFETYLDLRQLQALKKPSLPPQLKGVVSDEKFEKSKAYQLDKRWGTTYTSVLWLAGTCEVAPMSAFKQALFAR